MAILTQREKVVSHAAEDVFHSVHRTRRGNLNGSGRQALCEHILKAWRLQNLNQPFVMSEDFNVCKQLTRTNAEEFFGNLHLRFHASMGRPGEKNDPGFCNLVSVQAYRHLSKLKSSMGVAFHEPGAGVRKRSPRKAGDFAKPVRFARSSDSYKRCGRPLA